MHFPQQSEAEQRQIIEEHGGRFDGSSWMLLMQASEPLEETVMVVACDEQVMTGSQGKPTGLAMRLYETSSGAVLHLLLTLFDRPDRPFIIDLVVNPAHGAGDDMVGALAEQQTLQMLFYDAASAKPMGRRIIRLDEDLRDGLLHAVRVGRQYRGSLSQWQAALDATADLRL
jgi:hypothetical protein